MLPVNLGFRHGILGGKCAGEKNVENQEYSLVVRTNEYYLNFTTDRDCKPTKDHCLATFGCFNRRTKIDIMSNLDGQSL